MLDITYNMITFNNCNYSIKGYSNALQLFYHSLTGTLPNVSIMRTVTNTTDVRIVLNDIPSSDIPTDTIGRVIVGYERHDLGVTLQGEYANIFRRTERTFSSLVPGARYTVVVQGVTTSVTGRQRSQHVTRRDFITKVKGQGNITFHLNIFISY